MPMQEPTYWILTSLAAGRRHGYAILADVDVLTEGRVRLRITTLYSALDRLQRDGLIAEAGDEVVEGRRRRYIVLTEHGAAALRAEALRLAHAAQGATQRLRAFGWAARTAG